MTREQERRTDRLKIPTVNLAAATRTQRLAAPRRGSGGGLILVLITLLIVLLIAASMVYSRLPTGSVPTRPSGGVPIRPEEIPTPDLFTQH